MGAKLLLCELANKNISQSTICSSKAATAIVRKIGPSSASIHSYVLIDCQLQQSIFLEKITMNKASSIVTQLPFLSNSSRKRIISKNRVASIFVYWAGKVKVNLRMFSCNWSVKVICERFLCG